MPLFKPSEINFLFEQHAPALLLYLKQWLDEATAQDLVQDCFIQLINERRRPDEIRPWLFRVARNKALNWIRGTKRRIGRETLQAQLDQDLSENWFTSDLGSTSPSEIQELLEKLDQTERETVVLRIWGDCGFDAIAGILNVSTSKAFRVYQSALNQLRKSFEADKSSFIETTSLEK